MPSMKLLLFSANNLVPDWAKPIELSSKASRSEAWFEMVVLVVLAASIIARISTAEAA